MTLVALDTSVAVPLLLRNHAAHPAAENGLPLATRDARARDTYQVTGAKVIVVG